MTQKNSRSILIVNSEPDTADLFAELLLMADENYIVSTASTGKECLLTLERDAPDMVLLDIELSDMDGWKLIEIIKEFNPDFPVVIVTAKPPGMDDFSRLPMVSDYLVKPVTIDCLHIAVRDALEVPILLDKCIESVKLFKDKEEILYLLEKKYIQLMKQVIIDRKRFVLMRQLYSDRKIKNEPDTRLLLDNLREEIDKAHNELEDFKSKQCLLFTT